MIIRERIYIASGGILVGLIVAFIMLSILGGAESPGLSLLQVAFSAVIGIGVTALSFRGKLGVQILWVAILVYFVKLAISIAHYLYFLESNYFSSPVGYFPYINDYAQLDDFMGQYADYWRGLSLAPPLDEGVNKKATVLVAYHALLYYFSNNYVLNFAAWSSFHTIMVAFVMVWYGENQKLARPQLWFIFLLSALQPMFLYSDMMARDIIGQFWLLVGLTAIAINIRRLRILILITPIALFLAYELRNLYVVVILIYLLLANFLCFNDGARKKITPLMTLILLVFIGAIFIDGDVFFKIFSTYYSENASGGVINEAYQERSIVGSFIRAFFGPFPWTQVSSDSIGWVSLPMEFLQSWLALTIYSSAFPIVIRLWREQRVLDKGVLLWLLFFLAGAMSGVAHIGYTNVVLVFLLPIVSKIPLRYFLRNGAFSFGLYFIGNIMFNIFGLSGSGMFR